MTGAEISGKLLFLSANQAQAVDAVCLLLDALDSEGEQITQGKFAAENFMGRLRMYVGAFHFIVDGLDAAGKALEELADQMDTRERVNHEDQT